MLQEREKGTAQGIILYDAKARFWDKFQTDWFELEERGMGAIGIKDKQGQQVSVMKLTARGSVRLSVVTRQRSTDFRSSSVCSDCRLSS